MNKKPILYILLLLALSGGIVNADCNTGCSSSSSDCNSGCDSGCEKVVTDLCTTCDCVVNSRTHFFVNPLGQLQSPEYQSLFYDRLTAKHEGDESAFQAVVFGGNSTERGKLATYFTPFCKTELRVNTASENNRGTDVISDYFNVQTANGNFESIIRFAPRETAVGVLLAYQKRFGERESGKAFWVGVSTPITYIKNTMGFSEDVIDDGGGLTDNSQALASGAVANMTDAFRNPLWDCAKINCACDMTKIGLADITAVLGVETLNSEDCYLESHVGFSIPTGNHVRGRYLFEPIIGQDKHAGVIIGSSADIRMWESERNDQAFWFHIHAHGVYLIENTQSRLINLVNKPWSAFMRMYANQAQAQSAVNADNEFLYTPGVNIMCQDVCVKPGFQRTFHTAFTYLRHNFEAEFGYNAWVRPAECVTLLCPWPGTAALVANDGIPGSVDPVQQINDDFASRNSTGNIFSDIGAASVISLYSSNTIQLCDLDLQSASHPCVFTHTVFVALGHHWDDRENPIFAGVGGSYEFLHDNAGLERWTIWAKAGLSW